MYAVRAMREGGYGAYAIGSMGGGVTRKWVGGRGPGGQLRWERALFGETQKGSGAFWRETKRSAIGAATYNIFFGVERPRSGSKFLNRAKPSFLV